MKSRAELLAELEEDRHKNKELQNTLDSLSTIGFEVEGYDPYDNPGTSRELPAGAEFAKSRRSRRR